MNRLHISVPIVLLHISLGVVPSFCAQGHREIDSIRPVIPSDITLTDLVRSTKKSAPKIDLLADPNDILARIKTFEGLEKEIERIGIRSSNELNCWGEYKDDNRILLAGAVREQIENELAFVRKIAFEEKATKTVKAVDVLAQRKKDLYKRIVTQLQQQRRATLKTQGVRTGSRSSGPTAVRPPRYQRYSPVGVPPDKSIEIKSQNEGDPNNLETNESNKEISQEKEAEKLERESQDEIRQWLQTTVKNKPDLTKKLHARMQTGFVQICNVAMEEKTKKTLTAVEGIMLARQIRFVICMEMADASKRISESRQEPPRPKDTGTRTGRPIRIRGVRRRR